MKTNRYPERKASGDGSKIRVRIMSANLGNTPLSAKRVAWALAKDYARPPAKAGTGLTRLALKRWRDTLGSRS
jgi:hypothetical protein